MMWNGWDAYGPAWFGLMHLVWWLLLIAGATALIKVILRPGSRRSEDGARQILRERYARGEIDREEFDERVRQLDA